MSFTLLRGRINGWFRSVTGKGADTITYEHVDGQIKVTARGLLTDYERNLLKVYPDDPSVIEPLFRLRRDLAFRCSPGWDEFLTATIVAKVRLEQVEVELSADRVSWTFARAENESPNETGN
jgi:hypothetical protein